MTDTLPSQICPTHGIAVIPARGACRKCLSGEPAAAPALPARKGIAAPLSCRHLGAPTGEKVACLPCKRNTQLGLFACALHGDCTPKTPLADHACCATCPDFSPPDAASVVVTADGIGDAVLGLTACAGLQRQHPAQEVIYCPKPWTIPWLWLFEGYDRLGDGSEPAAHVYRPHDTYAAQNAERLARPRWEHYAAACGTKAVLPAAKPLSPDAVRWAEAFRGAVVLAPFSGYGREGSPPELSNNRVWLGSHWLHLERLLQEQGRRVVVLDGRTEHHERTHAFRSVVLRDEPPERVAAVMCLADCFVGGDSGMAHVALTLRVPGAVLCGHIRGAGVFGIYPTVRVLDGPLPCTGCHGQGKYGWHPVCDTVCASLQLIQPADVLRAVEEVAAAPPGLVRDPAADRLLAEMLSHLQAPVPDRRGTMEAFLRHLAAIENPLVVETGCMRSDDDYGAGMSTLLFGRFLAAHGGRLISIDNSREHCEFARSRIKGLPVEVVEADSREWLAAYRGAAIDGVYLDSADVWEKNHQECNLQEAQAVLPSLSDGAAVLIDDTWPLGNGHGGKGAKTVPMLLEKGWIISHSGYQTLLCRA